VLLKSTMQLGLGWVFVGFFIAGFLRCVYPKIRLVVGGIYPVIRTLVASDSFSRFLVLYKFVCTCIKHRICSQDVLGFESWSDCASVTFVAATMRPNATAR